LKRSQLSSRLKKSVPGGGPAGAGASGAAVVEALAEAVFFADLVVIAVRED
jgi:hypothetical protein